MMTAYIKILFCITALLFVGCDPKEAPSRDEIPVVKNLLARLQTGIAEKNRAVIDSMLSIEILDINQGSDSLLNLVYSSEDDFRFERLGNYEILYSHDIALIDCFIQDSTYKKDKPIRLYFKKDDDIWLMTKFEMKETDSLISW